MSYCGTIPVEWDDPIDSGIIDSCLGRVRAEVGRDEDLPSLEAVIKPALPARLIVGDLPNAEAIVRRSPVQRSQLSSGPLPREERTARPHERMSLVQRLRWPVFFCGFLSGVCGGVALMKSPVGRQPTVQRAAKAIHRGAVNALAVTSAARARLVAR